MVSRHFRAFGGVAYGAVGSILVASADVVQIGRNQ